MHVFVNNLNILQLFIYIISINLIWKLVSLFEIMNALIVLTVWSDNLGYMHACEL